MGRGGVGLLGGQLTVVVTAIQTLGVRGTAEIFLKHTRLSVTQEGAGLCRYLVDTVPQGVRDPAHNGPPHLAGGHLSQLYGGGLTIEGSVGCGQQVGGIFERGVACNRISLNIVHIHNATHT